MDRAPLGMLFLAGGAQAKSALATSKAVLDDESLDWGLGIVARVLIVLAVYLMVFEIRLPEAWTGAAPAKGYEILPDDGDDEEAPAKTKKEPPSVDKDEAPPSVVEVVAYPRPAPNSSVLTEDPRKRRGVKPRPSSQRKTSAGTS